MDKIKKNTVVSMLIKLEDKEGNIIDESEELMYIHGGYNQIFKKLEDELEGKTGKYIEGSRDGLWSNKEKRTIRGINVVSLNYSDGYSNFMVDFAIAMGNYARVKFEEFTQEIDIRTTAYKRRLEIMEGKSKIAIDMIKRALQSGIQADYLLIDSWYSKPAFLKEMNDLGLKVISRIANNNKIWNFAGREKTLNSVYEKQKKSQKCQSGKIWKKDSI